MTWTDRLLWAALGACVAVCALWLIPGPDEVAPPAPTPSADEQAEELVAIPGGGRRFGAPPPDGEPAPRTARDEAAPEPAGGHPPEQPEPGVGQAYALTLESTGPSYVVVGETFEMTHVLSNVGTLTLTDVAFATRGTGGIESTPDAAARSTIERMLPGASVTRRVTYVARQAGKATVPTSARDQRGWAAAGSFARIRAGTGAAPQDDTDALRLALSVRAELRTKLIPGEPFTVRLHVENRGDLALTNVKLGSSGLGGVERIGDTTPLPALAHFRPGARVHRDFEFVAPASGRAENRAVENTVLVSAREERGWAAAGGRLLLPREDEAPR